MSDLDTGIKAHSIQQTTFLGKNPQGNSIDAKGFVKPPDLGGFGDYAALDQSMSSNCAVTWYALDRPDSQNGKPMRYYYLYIHPKGRSITFMFSGISDAGQEPNDVLDELSLIRESIRIEKIR
jgi:hypothetical protein